MDRFIKSCRERFVVASLDIFLDLTLCVFAEVDICYHFFMKGELLVCFQRNDCFDHVSFLFSFRCLRVFGAFVFNMRGVRYI